MSEPDDPTRPTDGAARRGEAAGERARGEASGHVRGEVGEGAGGEASEGLDGEGARGEADEDELVPPANPPRPLRGGVALGVGALVTLAVMGRAGQARWAIFAGLAGVITAAVGALDLAGTFDDEGEPVASVALRELAGPLAALAVAAATAVGALTMATQGALPAVASGVLVTGAALATLVAGFRVGERLGVWARDEDGRERPLGRRHGFWLVAAACALYLPAMGAHSLTDPWETHYGEVAREMLSRDDWISTWWAQDGWFFSKPVLNFWLQALAMAGLGVQYRPGQMLAGAVTPQPEWAVRAPVVALTVAALYLIYKGVARVFGRRAGLLGALVLMSMPQWAMLAHQTMADMPFVAAMTGAMGLLLLGLNTDPQARVGVYEVRLGAGRVRLSAVHLALGAALVASLPQIFYLVSRNLELVWEPFARGWRLHPDVFAAGSPGNCGLPGNEPCVTHEPYNRLLQPALQGGLWALALGALVHLNAGERRVQRLLYIGAFLCAAVSTLGKGPAGLALPALCALLYVAVTGKWRELTRLEILSGALLLLAVALPWYLAMFLRHGPAFVDRLIFHDMWKRALTHVHDTNEGDDVGFRFYVWQLGYAVFPWTGLVPAGLVWWARRPDDADRGRGDTSVFLVTWFVLAFALFTAMLTKFHHYIFPAVPPAAMLTGVLLDRALGDAAPRPARLAALGGAGALLAVGLSLLGPGRLDGLAPGGALAPAAPAASALALAAAAGLAWWGGRGAPGRGAGGGEGALALGALLVSGAAGLALVGRDLVARPLNEVVGDARLLHLFTYNYRRLWPADLGFGAVLGGTAGAAAVLTVLLGARRWRPGAAAALVGLGLAFAAWGLDVYLVKTAPHWGQREVLAAYYRARTGPEQMVVAYQMNWKGENFYTGNHIPAFVSTGDRFKAWLRGQRERGVSVVFFVVEQGRVGHLRNELGAGVQLETLVDRATNNKFTLVRATWSGAPEAPGPGPLVPEL